MRPDSLPRLWRYINLLLTYLLNVKSYFSFYRGRPVHECITTVYGETVSHSRHCAKR